MLEQDIRELQDKIAAALDCYYQLRGEYGELGGWDMVENKLTLALGWAEIPIEIEPIEEQYSGVQ